MAPRWRASRGEAPGEEWEEEQRRDRGTRSGRQGDWGRLVSHVPGKVEASGCGEEVGSIRFGEIREAEN